MLAFDLCPDYMPDGFRLERKEANAVMISKHKVLDPHICFEFCFWKRLPRYCAQAP